LGHVLTKFGKRCMGSQSSKISKLSYTEENKETGFLRFNLLATAAAMSGAGNDLASTPEAVARRYVLDWELLQLEMSESQRTAIMFSPELSTGEELGDAVRARAGMSSNEWESIRKLLAILPGLVETRMQSPPLIRALLARLELDPADAEKLQRKAVVAFLDWRYFIQADDSDIKALGIESFETRACLMKLMLEVQRLQSTAERTIILEIMARFGIRSEAVNRWFRSFSTCSKVHLHILNRLNIETDLQASALESFATVHRNLPRVTSEVASMIPLLARPCIESDLERFRKVLTKVGFTEIDEAVEIFITRFKTFEHAKRMAKSDLNDLNLRGIDKDFLLREFNFYLDDMGALRDQAILKQLVGPQFEPLLERVFNSGFDNMMKCRVLGENDLQKLDIRNLGDRRFLLHVLHFCGERVDRVRFDHPENVAKISEFLRAFGLENNFIEVLKTKFDSLRDLKNIMLRDVDSAGLSLQKREQLVQVLSAFAEATCRLEDLGAEPMRRESDVLTKLREIDLERFHEHLLAGGYDSVALLRRVSHADLRRCGITLFSQRDKIISAFRNARSVGANRDGTELVPIFPERDLRQRRIRFSEQMSDAYLIHQVLLEIGTEQFFDDIITHHPTIQACKNLTHSDLRSCGVALFGRRDRIIKSFREFDPTMVSCPPPCWNEGMRNVLRNIGLEHYHPVLSHLDTPEIGKLSSLELRELGIGNILVREELRKAFSKRRRVQNGVSAQLWRSFESCLPLVFAFLSYEELRFSVARVSRAFRDATFSVKEIHIIPKSLVPESMFCNEFRNALRQSRKFENPKDFIFIPHNSWKDMEWGSALHFLNPAVVNRRVPPFSGFIVRVEAILEVKTSWLLFKKVEDVRVGRVIQIDESLLPMDVKECVLASSSAEVLTVSCEIVTLKTEAEFSASKTYAIDGLELKYSPHCAAVVKQHQKKVLRHGATVCDLRLTTSMQKTLKDLPPTIPKPFVGKTITQTPQLWLNSLSGSPITIDGEPGLQFIFSIVQKCLPQIRAIVQTSSVEDALVLKPIGICVETIDFRLEPGETKDHQWERCCTKDDVGLACLLYVVHSNDDLLRGGDIFFKRRITSREHATLQNLSVLNGSIRITPEDLVPNGRLIAPESRVIVFSPGFPFMISKMVNFGDRVASKRILKLTFIKIGTSAEDDSVPDPSATTRERVLRDRNKQSMRYALQHGPLFKDPWFSIRPSSA